MYGIRIVATETDYGAWTQLRDLRVYHCKLFTVRSTILGALCMVTLHDCAEHNYGSQMALNFSEIQRLLSFTGQNECIASYRHIPLIVTLVSIATSLFPTTHFHLQNSTS